jgi:serine/threonine-protein kinase SRPK3
MSCATFSHTNDPHLIPFTQIPHRYTSEETTKYAAIKILTAHASAKVALDLSPEFEVHQKIASANPSHPGFQHCLTLNGYLTTKSAAGDHIGYVMEPLGSDIRSLAKTFTVPAVKRVMKQLLLALDYLHRECGYIHTGNMIYHV